MTNTTNVLLNIKNILNKIGMLPDIVSSVNCDEPFYQVCKENQSDTETEFDNMAFQLGGFALSQNFPWRYWKRMGESGFSKIFEGTLSYGPTIVDGNVWFEGFK